MNDDIREELHNTLKEEKSDCRKEFMSQKSFYRSVLVGVITILGLMGGGLAWAFNISGDTTSLKISVGNNTDRIKFIEKTQKEYHQEQMTILKEINSKVK